MNTLRARLIALTAILQLVTAVVVAAVVIFAVRSELLSRVKGEVQEIAAGHSAMIGSWIGDRYAIMASTLPAVGSENPMPMLQQSKAGGRFDLVYIGYADKRTLFTDNQDLPPGYDPTGRPWYTGAVKAGKPILTEPYEDASTKQLVVSFAAPAVVNGQVAGVVASDISLDGIVKTVLGIKPLGSGHAFVADRSGKVLVHPEQAFVLKPATDIAPELNAAGLSASADAGTLIEATIAGKPSLVFMHKVANSDWLLGLVIERNAALHTLETVAKVTLVALVLVLLVAVPLTAYLVGRMLRRLKRMRDLMQDIASGGGDLTRQLEVSGNDEIAQASAAFNRFLAHLRGMFASVREESDRVTAEVGRIHLEVDKVAADSESLSDHAAANAATIEEITVSISHIADHSGEANQRMAETGRLSSDSAQKIDQVASEVGRTADAVQSLAKTLGDLNHRSQEISGITNVIKEIADQTNLLALNAAIEAARAGEQGRGFAVVADEVRKLAERTAQATVQITEMIRAIVDETQSASGVMGSTLETVSRGVALSHEATDKIAEIGQAIRVAAEKMDDIANLTREQELATNQMAQTAERITGGMRDSDAALQRARSSLGDLEESARRLHGMMANFRL